MRPHRSLCVQYIYIHHPAKNFSVPRWFHQLLKGTSLHLNLCWSLAVYVGQPGYRLKILRFMWWHRFSTNSTAPLLEGGPQTIQQYENESMTNPVIQLEYHRHNPLKVQNCFGSILPPPQVATLGSLSTQWCYAAALFCQLCYKYLELDEDLSQQISMHIFESK